MATIGHDLLLLLDTAIKAIQDNGVFNMLSMSKGPTPTDTQQVNQIEEQRFFIIVPRWKSAGEQKGSQRSNSSAHEKRKIAGQTTRTGPSVIKQQAIAIA